MAIHGGKSKIRHKNMADGIAENGGCHGGEADAAATLDLEGPTQRDDPRPVQPVMTSEPPTPATSDDPRWRRARQRPPTATRTTATSMA